MPLGTYFGAGSVRNLYRCYVGAGGVRNVTGIYIGQNGSAKRVWPSGLIYDTGVIYEPMTLHLGTTSTEYGITYGSSYLSITNNRQSTTGSYGRAMFMTDSTIDMSLYSTMTVVYRVTSSGSTGSSYGPNIYMGVGDSSTYATYIPDIFDAYIDFYVTEVGTTFITRTIDISGVTAADYVKIYILVYSNTAFNMDIQRIELS